MSEEEPNWPRESRVKLAGGRYDSEGLPIEALPELVQYERLVVDMAKTIWLRQHQGRERVPKGFSERVSLRLIDVGEGSVVPVMERPQVAGSLPDVDPQSVLDEAQDAIDDAFAAIISNNKLPQDFPPDLARHFLRLGRTLVGNEALVLRFRSGEQRQTLRYTQNIRKKFLSTTQVEDFQVDGSLLGRVTALDLNSSSFTLTDLDGHQIPGVFSDPGQSSDLHEAFKLTGSAPIVRVECTQLLSSDQALKEIQDVRLVEVFLAPDAEWGGQLVDLLRVPEGWLDGEGVPPDLVVVERARDLLFACADRDLAIPALFPRIGGGVQAEWYTATDAWTVVIDPDELLVVDYLDVPNGASGELESTDVGDIVNFLLARQIATDNGGGQ